MNRSRHSSNQAGCFHRVGLSWRPRRRQDRRGRRSSGQAIVEFALIFGVLIMVVMAIFDFGFAFYSLEAITNGAREGARFAVGDPTNTNGITTTARSQLVLLDPNQVGVSIATRGGNTGWGNPITVTVTYTYAPITPVLTTLTGSGYQMTAKSSMTIE